MNQTPTQTLYNTFPHPQKIAILRALNLGDLMCTIPSFRALRRAYPDAHISLFGLPWAHEFVNRFSAYFDEFIEFPGFPGFPEQPVDAVKITEFFSRIQSRKFDLILQMQGSGKYSNLVTSLFRADTTAGYYPHKGFKPSKFFFPNSENANEVLRYIQLMQKLGITVTNQDLEFPITPQDKKEYKTLLKEYSIKKPYIIIHTGAQNIRRRWDIEKFAQVADFLSNQGFQIILTGTGKEKELIDKLQRIIVHSSINLAGKTSLGILGVLIDKAPLLISNDTGVSHIAAACKTPSVIIFSPYSEPKRWAPLNRELHTVITKSQAQNPKIVIKAAMEKLRSEIKIQKSKLINEKPNFVFEL